MSAPGPFTPIPLFAFPLYVGMVGGADEHKDALVAHILKCRKENAGIVRSNRSAWHSGPDFEGVDHPDVTWAMRQVKKYARRALAPVYDGWSTRKLVMGSYWANVLDKGGWNSPHHHVPQHWSAVYYVQASEVGEGGRDLRGMIEFVNPNVNQSHFGGGQFAYGPRDGMILLFPSSLMHFVNPHDSDVPRISIATNFDVVPKESA